MKLKVAALSLASAMTLAMGAGLLSACKQVKYEIDWEADLSTPIEINAVYPETGISGFEAGENGNDTAKIIKDTTGYTVKYKELGGDADNQINNMLLSKDKYHIMKLTSAQYTPYLEDGLFLDISEILEKTEPGKKVKELISLMDYGWDAVSYTNADGKTGIYGIPDFGYCVMEDSALIWNTDHLEAIGYDHVPTTLSETTDALNKLQAQYGTNTNYHALGIGGANSARLTPFMSAFECPIEFGLDKDGKVQLYIYDDSCKDYVAYMNNLKRSGVISDSWQNSSASDLCDKFSKGLSSCAYLSYWWVKSLIKSINTNMDGYKGDDNYQKVHDELLGWNTRIRADGYTFTDVKGVEHTSPTHEKAMIHGGDDGVSYYTVIPYYMAKYALNIMDFLAKKLENFAAYYGGTEGVHWNKVEAPEGAPAEYDENDMFCMQPWEDMKTKTIYMRPYSYQYQGGTVSGGGYWIQLTDAYAAQIADNSQYCNGTNKIEASVLFHLRETGFDAWQITQPMDDTIITNPMTMSPPFKWWSPVNILSRTDALYGIAEAIDSKDDPCGQIDFVRNKLKQTKKSVGGVKYYYWSDDISNEMTNWYNTVKKNRT